MKRALEFMAWLALGVSFLGIGAAAGSPVWAESPGTIAVRTTTDGSLPDAPVRLQIEEGNLSLSLEEAVETALERNLGLRVERYNREQSQLSVFGNRGIYDTRLDISGLSSESTPATVDRTRAGTNTFESLEGSVSQLTAFGGDFSFTLSNSRTQSENEFFAAATAFNTNAQLSFAQPLLRDFGRLATARGLLIAQVNSRASREDFELQVNGTVQDVENAYWTLIDAREQLNVAEEALGLAEELHERNKIEVEVGTRAPLELVQSEANIATRQEEIIRAQTAVGDAEDQLRRLLNLPDDLWELSIEPTTPALSEPIEIDLDAAIRTAFAERPEVRSQRLSIERLEIDSDYFRNQKKPRLDLNLRWNSGGVSSKELDEDLFDAYSRLFARDFTGWSVGLTYAVPLQNRSAKANSLSADLAVEQEQVRLEELKRQILTEVRGAVRQVNSAAQQITSAQVSKRLQEKNLEAEQKRYENGMSTSFQVTQIQDDLTQARSREVSAITNYRTALAAYYRSIGELLDQFGVEIYDPAAQEAGE
jgi:outer membrane protein TolC